MSLRVYNTLSKQKEPFQTVQPGKVGIYCCGPTVYMPSHIGHMVGPVIFDCIKRYLVYKGYDVTLVINITDVDDKLIVRAQQENTTVDELAKRVTDDYLGHLAKLGVDSIDHMPRATEYIDPIIAMVQRLIDKGHAYPADGDVYFDVTTDDDYGKLSHRKIEELDAGARIEVDERKRHPGDFALWKAAKPGEPSWDSPWGPGRPGWHIECSAMSSGLLGESFDIHGGGLDLVFPHHENEISQSESCHDKPYVTYWMHHGLMQMDKEKMSKSIGNLVTVSELLERHSPEVVRFFLLSTHYRRPIDFSDERIAEVGRGVDGFYRFFERVARITGANYFEVSALEASDAPKPEGPFAPAIAEFLSHRNRFLECMDDDFNTGGAAGVLFDLLGALNRMADQADLEGKGKGDATAQGAFNLGVRILRELTGVLGVFGRAPAKAAGADDAVVDGLVRLAIDVRAMARKQKQFDMADAVRDGLKDLGIVLEDRPDETTWRWV